MYLTRCSHVTFTLRSLAIIGWCGMHEDIVSILFIRYLAAITGMWRQGTSQLDVFGARRSNSIVQKSQEGAG